MIWNYLLNFGSPKKEEKPKEPKRYGITVKDLIAELQKCDPDAIVNTRHGPVHYVDQLPGYYDGPYKVLVDNFTMKFTKQGTKVFICDRTLEDMYTDCDSYEELDKVKVIVDTSCLSSKEWIEKYAKEKKEIGRKGIESYMKYKEERGL